MSNKSKNQSKSSRSLTPLSLSIIATTLVSGVAIALAWTGPGASPYANNTEAPINVGGVNQIKSAVITAGGLISSGGLRTGLSTMLGDVNLTPRSTLEVNGNIGTTALYNLGAGYQWANLGGTSIMASNSIYSYGSICAGGSLGDCTGTSGVVIGGTNTAALVNITNTGNSFFNVGNVGIGTNSVTTGKLRIVGGEAMTAGWGKTLVLQASYPVAIFNSLGTAKWAGIGYDGGAAQGLKFWVNTSTEDVITGTQALTINNNANVIVNSGNFGVGTTTPATKLAVQGGILAQGTIRSGTGGYIFPDGTTQTTAATGQWTTSGADIYNANAGNVGIGDSTPTGKLTFGNNLATGFLDNYSEYQTIFYDSGSAGNSYGIGVKADTLVLNSGSGAYSFDRAGSLTTMALTTNGNVGIGVIPTTARLQISSSAGLTALQVIGATNNLYIDNVGGGANYLRGGTYFNGVLYDEGNSAYYLDPAGTSITNDLRANILYDRADTNFYVQPSQVSLFNDARANVFYDRTDTSYYVQPRGTSVLASLQVGKTTTTSAAVNLANNITTHSIFNNTDGQFYIGTGRDSGGVRRNINLYNLSCVGTCNVPAINLYADNTAMTGSATVASTLTAGGVIRSTAGGFQFPDNTIQTTAAAASQWTTSGADIFNSNTGNVGIGGAPSTSKLHVQAASNPQFQLRSQSTGGRGLWTTVDDTAGVISLNSSYGTVGSYPITFQLGNVEQMRLHSNGNIGLGRTAPASKLEVGGDSVFFGAAGTSYFSSGAANYIRGNTYFNGVLYDENNAGYYVDPNATSKFNNQIVDGNTSYGTVRSGSIGVYDAANTQAVFAMGAAYTLPAGGSSTDYGNFYGIAWSYDPGYGGAGNNPQSKAGLTHQALFMQAGTTRTAIGNGIWSNGIIHSNTGGFKFPDGSVQTTASTGLTGAVRTDVAGDWNIASNAVNSAYNTAAFEIREANFAGAQTGVAGEAPRIGFHWGGRVASQIGMDSAGTIRTYNNPGTGYEAFAASSITANGNITSTGSVGAVQFGTNAGSWLSNGGTTNYLRGNTYANGVYFDESNSAYYLDPAATSITNDLRANILYDVGNTGYYVDPNATSITNDFRANIFVDAANPAYYVTPRGVSIMNDVRGNIFYDQGNTGYYVDPASTSNLNVLNTQSQSVAGGIINSEWYRSSGNGGWYSNTHGGGLYMSDTTYIRTYGSKSFYHDAGVMRTDGTLQVGSGGATFNAPNGGNTAVGYGLTVATTGTFGGNVTAPAFIYSSDERLKDNITELSGSLDKVRALKGYTFSWKKDGKADVGLVAQQVETVFPELVHTDTTTGLKSVQYGNLVAPLIEAVKELANSFEALATRVFNTESRQTELEKANAVQAEQIAGLQRQINLLQNK